VLIVVLLCCAGLVMAGPPCERVARCPEKAQRKTLLLHKVRRIVADYFMIEGVSFLV
jgi:hypothetical protein